MFHPQGPTFMELATQAMSGTKAGYDLIAPKFDYTPFRTPPDLLEAVAPHIGAPGSVGAGLDVCCGTGAGMILLRPLCAERVVGIDFSPGMLAEAERRASLAPGDAALEFVCGDVLAMPFDAVFDVAVCFGAFGHILERDQPKFVAEIYRALRPGGRFVFLSATMPSPLSRAWVLSRGFNFAMHVRNAVYDPPFIMYYLNFMLPRVRVMLESVGFEVEARPGLFESPYARYQLVVATRPA